MRVNLQETSVYNSFTRMVQSFQHLDEKIENNKQYKR